MKKELYGVFGDKENKLIQRLQRGDASAFAAFVDQYGPQVHRLSRRYARSEADAEDLTQEVFIALSQGIAGFRGEARLSTFVYRVAINHCLKHAQRRPTLPDCAFDGLPLAASESDGPAARAVHGELTARIDRALGTLPDGQREVVVLHEMHGLTYAECAAVLGVPVGTVKSRLFNAFGRLRERLGSYVRGEEEPPVMPPTRNHAAKNGGAPAAAMAAMGETR